MLASELAQELNIDPTLMSKRLTTYHWEAQTEKTRLLNSETVEQVREAHRLLNAGGAKTFRQGVLMVLGEYQPSIEAEQARQIVQRLKALEAGQARLIETVEWMAEHMRARAGRQEQSASRTGGLLGAAQGTVGGVTGHHEGADRRD